MKHTKISVFLFLIWLPFFSSAFAETIGEAEWAKSVTSSSQLSMFRSVAADSNGNVYAVGHIHGTGTFNFGNGVTVSGTNSTENIVVVKYDSNGTAQWAKSVTSGINKSQFYGMAVDGSGNIYAVGQIYGSGTFGFGGGVTTSGTYTGYNLIFVKYDSNGTAQWAKSVTTGPAHSSFNSVAVDSDGTLYVAGAIWGAGTYNFGNSVTASGTFSEYNVVLVKYYNNGNAQWAKSVTSGTEDSRFYSVSLDGNGNICAAGKITGNGTYGFGNGVSTSGTDTGDNILLVKYASDGTAQWAKSVSSSNPSDFYSVAANSNGDIYAAGKISGYTGTYADFGNGVTISYYDSTAHLVLVKYANNGDAKWAKSVGTGDPSEFRAVALGGNGEIYAAGEIDGTGTYYFGNDVTTSGTYSSDNVVLVKYDSDGNAEWAKSVTSGASSSNFYSVAIDSNKNIYAAGSIVGSNNFDFGKNVTVNGTYAGSNVVLVKYEDVALNSDAKLISPSKLSLLGSIGAIILLLP